jgi:hypothetical protein
MMRKQNGFFPNPGPGLKDPMEYTFGHRFFDFFEANEEHRQAFDDYMASRRQISQPQWFDIYPLGDRIVAHPVKDPSKCLVCDVGGGQGHELVRSFDFARSGADVGWYQAL